AGAVAPGAEYAGAGAAGAVAPGAEYAGAGAAGAVAAGGGGGDAVDPAWPISRRRRNAEDILKAPSEAVSDAQVDADHREIEVGKVHVVVGVDPELEVALGDEVHSDAGREDKLHAAPVGDVEPGLEPDAEGDRVGGGVEGRAEQRAPDLEVAGRNVKPAQVDPVEVVAPVGERPSREERRADLRTLGGEGSAAVGGEGKRSGLAPRR